MDWTTVQSTIAPLLDQPGLSVSFTWQYRPYVGARSQLKREAVAADRGLEGQYDFSLTCSTVQFGGHFPEARRDKIMIAGHEYRVLSTDTDAVGATIRLNLGGVAQ